jgi:hypothetical protein
MNPSDLVDLYTTGFRICLAITLIALAVAVYLFIKLDIRSVFMLVSGRKRKKTIKQLSEAQERTDQIGPAMPNLDFGNTGGTGKLARSRVGGLFRRSGRSGELSPPTQPGMDTMPLSAAGESPGANSANLDTAQMADVEVAAKPLGSAAQRIGFKVTERTLVIHTNELIDI